MPDFKNSLSPCIEDLLDSNFSAGGRWLRYVFAADISQLIFFVLSLWNVRTFNIYLIGVLLRIFFYVNLRKLNLEYLSVNVATKTPVKNYYSIWSYPRQQFLSSLLNFSNWSKFKLFNLSLSLSCHIWYVPFYLHTVFLHNLRSSEQKRRSAVLSRNTLLIV